MRLLVASDLDRTLVCSAAALGLDAAGVADEDAPALCVAEVHRGAPLSFLTARAAGHLREVVARGAALVPVTTRTRAQYARVHLPGVTPRHAVTTNGAHLLVDGEADPEWTAAVHERLSTAGAPLAEVDAHLAVLARAPFVLRHLRAEDAFAYLVVARDALPAGWLDDLAGWCATRGWSVSLQGRKVYAVPAALTKSAAVAEVARRTGAGRVVAGGDSLLDAELLEAADAAVRPAHGELHATGWTRPSVAVTARSGVLGAEDVAAWYLAQARAAADAAADAAAHPGRAAAGALPVPRGRRTR